jgi:hypothetical protein
MRGFLCTVLSLINENFSPFKKKKKKIWTIYLKMSILPHLKHAPFTFFLPFSLPFHFFLNFLGLPLNAGACEV